MQLHSRLESLLEEAHITLSSLVSDLLGTSARRMLQALAYGETDPVTVASLADQRLRATAAQLSDALSASTTLGQLDQQMADLLAEHHEAVRRLAEVPGPGVNSAQQIIAEVGATAATFPSPKHLASWMRRVPRQRTLVLLEEPGSHLHPPLLSFFTCMSEHQSERPELTRREVAKQLSALGVDRAQALLRHDDRPFKRMIF